jgi:hypothetical protein
MSWKWLWLPALVIAGLVLFLFGRNRNLIGWVKTELLAIDAKAKAKKLEANTGTAQARRQVEKEHKQTIKDLDEQQRQKAEKLASDPGALAAYLVRIGSSANDL